MINNLVPISNALSLLAEETDSDVLKLRPVLLRWAVWADVRIGSEYSYTTNYYLLDITDNTAEIPVPAVHMQNMILGDYLDRCPDIFNNIMLVNETEGIYEGNSVVWKWTENEMSPRCYSLPWTVQNNKIVFDATLNATQMTIKVLQYQTDVNGIPLVLESHLEAISLFLQAKLAMKQRWMRFKMGKLNNADRGMISDLKREFVNLARMVRADDADYSDDQMNEVGAIMNDPYTGSSNLNLAGL